MSMASISSCVVCCSFDAAADELAPTDTLRVLRLHRRAAAGCLDPIAKEDDSDVDHVPAAAGSPSTYAIVRPGGEMVWLQYAATRRQRAATACLFLTGAALIAFAARLSYANVEPQRAKAAERRKVLEAFIARKRAAATAAGGGGSLPQTQPDPPKP